MRWTCPKCGAVHGELPFGFESPDPAHLFAVPEAERAERVRRGSGWLTIDGRVGYVQGEIEVPVLREGRRPPGLRGDPASAPDLLVWAAWVALPIEAFTEHRGCSPFEGRDASWLGRLDTVIPIHPDSLGLRVLLHAPRVGRRPFVELEPTAHPLSREQWQGVDLARVVEIAATLWHLEEDAG